MDWIASAKKHFADKRPDVFTDLAHCPECRDHNETLSNSDVDKIGLEELGNPAWDPMCFISDEGYQYYFPALIRLCVSSDSNDYYLGQFLFQLTYDGKNNRHLKQFNVSQKSFVRNFCLYLLDEKIDEIDQCGDEDLLEQALSLWEEV